jgi:uncharacterized protein YecA (UPF0149 family)
MDIDRDKLLSWDSLLPHEQAEILRQAKEMGIEADKVKAWVEQNKANPSLQSQIAAFRANRVIHSAVDVELIDGAPKRVASKKQLGTARVGRNEPCPCGSGKKHKRCCLEPK